MKIYIITLSRAFLSRHPRAGQPTYFAAKFKLGIGYKLAPGEAQDAHRHPKIHTIRGNYDLWAKRIAEVQQGKAVLSIRQWAGKPYNSGQITIATLTAEHGVGVQKVEFSATLTSIDGVAKEIDTDVMAYNDGLCLKDFVDWFKGYDLSKPMALIHFTAFRY